MGDATGSSSALALQAGVLGQVVRPHRQHLGTFALSMLAVGLGAVAGVGAFAFRALIGFFHNLLFLGRFSWQYDSNHHTPPGPWGSWVVLAPVIGAVVVVFLVKNFAPEAKGHGVPEVMDAIYYAKGVIRPVVALVKSLASALSIGSGGSVGREGPIIQIGAAFASAGGQLGGRVALAARHPGRRGRRRGDRRHLQHADRRRALRRRDPACMEVSVRTLVPVALATATATYVGRYLLGSHPAFEIPATATPGAAELTLLPAYVGLGCLMALISVVFIRSLYGAEDLFERLIPNRPYLRHVTGMLCVGIMMVLLMQFAGHYYVEGVGYATILDVLSGRLANVGLLLALLALKLLATSLTLGSGASGGVFSPSLFMGATLGAAYGSLLELLFPGLHLNPATFALAGMAGLVAGATGAALTAIVMIFEMTLDYGVILPMTITAAVSYGLRRVLSAESIYTMKLTRRGHTMPQALQANAHLVRRVSDLELGSVLILPADAPLSALDLADGPSAPEHVVALRGADQIVGVAHRSRLLDQAAGGDRTRLLVDIVRRDFVTISKSATLVNLLGRMASAHASVAVVVPSSPKADAKPVIGIITQGAMAEALAAGMELFGD